MVEQECATIDSVSEAALLDDLVKCYGDALSLAAFGTTVGDKFTGSNAVHYATWVNKIVRIEIDHPEIGRLAREEILSTQSSTLRAFDRLMTDIANTSPAS